jgi:hypothetical protein
MFFYMKNTELTNDKLLSYNKFKGAKLALFLA